MKRVFSDVACALLTHDQGPFMMLDYVKKGEEVLTSYALKGASYIERQRNLRGWGFTCTCKLCTLDAADDHQRREQLMHFEFPRIGNNADALKRLAEEVERTYAKGRTLKPDAARVYSALAESEKLSDLSRFEVSCRVTRRQAEKLGLTLF